MGQAKRQRSGYSTDCWRPLQAQSASSRTGIAALARAVDLYRGDFLEGFYVDSQQFENWMLVRSVSGCLGSIRNMSRSMILKKPVKSR